MRYFIIFALFLSGCAAQSQLSDITSSDTLLTYNDLITPQFLRQHLEVIAHDTLEGRSTGMPGQKAAAGYLADYYSDLGFAPKGDNNTYFQRFNLNAEYTDSLVYSTYQIEGADTLLIDHSVESKNSNGNFIRMFGGSEPLRGDIVFAGFGLNDFERGVQHLEGVNLQNKWVLIFEDIPHIVDGDTLINPEFTGNSRLRTILGEKDAAGILLISDYSEEEYAQLTEISSSLMKKPGNLRLEYLDEQRRSAGFPKGFMQLNPSVAKLFLGLDEDTDLNDFKNSLTESIQEFTPLETSFILDYKPYDGPGYIETENVLAYLEGADPELKSEVLVLMAHYDHIGITQPDDTGDTINNGADDNGSGTVALMTIANAFHQAKLDGFRPKRSILFLHVTAEEVGLLGSRYYSDHPVIPIENTVANFNADMIGRSDPENIQRGDTDYVYLIGGEIISSELDSLVQAGNNNTVSMRLDRRYNDLQDRNQFYRRSDHWNFGRLGVPFVFFFTGVHEDYHRPSDTIDKIDFEKLSRVVRLIYASSIEVTNFDGRPTVDNEEFIEITRQLPR
jgi:hypothetical protein